MFISGVLKKKLIYNFSFTFFTIIIIFITFSLGIWQLKRLEWKNNLISSFESLKNSPPINLDHATELEFTKIEISGTINRAKKIFFPAKTLNGNTGVRLASVFISNTDKVYLLDEGWISNKNFFKFKNDKRMITEKITGYIRFSRKAKFFTPQNNIKKNEWYTYDLPEIRDYLGAPINQRFFIKKLNSNKEKDIISSSYKHQFRNNHWQYAVTWFCMSFAFLLIYIVYLKKNKK